MYVSYEVPVMFASV